MRGSQASHSSLGFSWRKNTVPGFTRAAFSLGVANSMPPVAIARSDSMSTSIPLSSPPRTFTPLVSQNTGIGSLVQQSANVQANLNLGR